VLTTLDVVVMVLVGLATDTGRVGAYTFVGVVVATETGCETTL
jgi:hypothetical protein